MFSFFKKTLDAAPEVPNADLASLAASPAPRDMRNFGQTDASPNLERAATIPAEKVPAQQPVSDFEPTGEAPSPHPLDALDTRPHAATPAAVAATATTAMSLFAPIHIAPPPPPSGQVAAESALPPARQGWLAKLRAGLARTGRSMSALFMGTKIDDALYEELEAALLMADSGVNATEFLLSDLKRRVKATQATDPQQVKLLLIEAIADLLLPLQKPLTIGQFAPTVIMVAGVNGAGKTTTIGKLTRHLADSGASVLLAAADTFRAAAREQLAVWATRNTVEIVSQDGGDPAAVAFDSVSAGKARGRDVVLVDTAGRLPTQLHLMDELKKIKRVVAKADALAPHEVILVIDGNTGQNALTQVLAFDEAIGLTGLVVTKLDGTAKGGVLCAIALWSRGRTSPAGQPENRPNAANNVPVYFIGVGEKLEDLETFNAREFAQALIG